MGLLDVLTPRGRGPMSPLSLAILGLLAWKGVKGASDRRAKADEPGAAANEQSAGPFGDMLRNSPLSSLFGGGTGQPADGTTRGFIGALLTGGLMDLVRQFQAAGKGRVAESWITTGDNEPISPEDLSKVLSEEQLAFLTERTGLTREELLRGLSERLPRTIDQLTPEGRVPTPEEASRP